MKFLHSEFLTSLGVSSFALLLVLLAVWSFAWKGVGLWFSARNYQKKWFIAILILNTAGIIEIIYLLFFRRDKREGVTKSIFDNPLPAPDENEEIISLKDEAVAQNSSV